MSGQDFNETLEQVIIYVLQRASSSKTGDKNALIQEYSDWLQCLGNPCLIYKDVFFINTLTFKDKYLKSKNLRLYLLYSLSFLSLIVNKPD